MPDIKVTLNSNFESQAVIDANLYYFNAASLVNCLAVNMKKKTTPKGCVYYKRSDVFDMIFHDVKYIANSVDIPSGYINVNDFLELLLKTVPCESISFGADVIHNFYMKQKDIETCLGNYISDKKYPWKVPLLKILEISEHI